jgi:hypothetical protein
MYVYSFNIKIIKKTSIRILKTHLYKNDMSYYISIAPEKTYAPCPLESLNSNMLDGWCFNDIARVRYIVAPGGHSRSKIFQATVTMFISSEHTVDYIENRYDIRTTLDIQEFMDVRIVNIAAIVDSLCSNIGVKCARFELVIPSINIDLDCTTASELYQMCKKIYPTTESHISIINHTLGAGYLGTYPWGF